MDAAFVPDPVDPHWSPLRDDKIAFQKRLFFNKLIFCLRNLGKKLYLDSFLFMAKI